MFLQLYRLIHYIMNESICKEIISGIIYSRKSLEGIMMIRLNVLELLEKKGKTRYWLYKQLGMSYQNFNCILKIKAKERCAGALFKADVLNAPAWPIKI